MFRDNPVNDLGSSSFDGDWNKFFNEKLPAALNYVKTQSDSYVDAINDINLPDVIRNNEANKHDLNRIPNLQNLYSGNTMLGSDPSSTFQLNQNEKIKNLLSYGRDINSWAKDPLQLAKPFDFNGTQYGAFFDRYYKNPKYKKLGFSPFRDNEAFYNANTTWKDDFVRMSKVWFNLAGDGFLGTIQNYGNFSMEGDLEHSEKMDYNMGIASSTRGGASAFTVNLLGNSAYTMGVMGEIMVEEAALFGLSFIPGLQGLSAGRTAMNVTRGIKVGKNLLGIVDKMSDIKNMVKSLKSIENATAFYKNAGKLAKGTLNFLNPLEYSADFFRSYNKIDDAAKLSRGFGSFYRDFRGINAALDEATLEGGFVQNKVSANLLDEYYKLNGKLPDPNSADADKIYGTGLDAGKFTSMINVPAILYTNKIVLDKMVRPSSMLLTEMGNSLKSYGLKKTVKDGAVLVEAYGKSVLKKDFWKQLPKNLGPGSFRYLSANFGEGAQELYQEGVSAGVEKYYSNLYNNPSKGGMEKYKSIAFKGAEEMLSNTGLDVFLSGFLMGGPVNVVQSGLFKGIQLATDNSYKIEGLFGKDITEKKEQAARIKAYKLNQVNQLAASLTVAYNNPDVFIKALDENAIEQRDLNADLDTALTKHNIYGDNYKAVADISADSVALHLNYLMEHGKLGILENQIKDINKLDDIELERSTGIANPTGQQAGEIRSKISKSLNSINQMKKIHKEFDEKFGSYDGNDALTREAFKRAKKLVVFNHAKAYNIVDRLQSIYSQMSSVSGLEGITASDITLLLSEIPAKFSSFASVPELQVLDDRIEILKNGDAKDQATAKLLEKQRLELDEVIESLKDYKQTYQLNEEGKKEGKEEVSLDSLKDDFKTKFTQYLKTVAESNGKVLDESKLDSISNSVLDYSALVQDKYQTTNAINVLANPQYFTELVNIHEKALKNIYNNRQTYLKEALSKYFNNEIDNELLNELFSKAGVFVDPDGMEDLAQGRMPTFYLVPAEAGQANFKDINIKLEEVDPFDNPVAYKKAMDIIESYEELNDITLTGKKVFRGKTAGAPVNRFNELQRFTEDKRTLRDFYEFLGVDFKNRADVELPLSEVLSKLIMSEYITDDLFNLFRLLEKKYRGKSNKVKFRENQGIPITVNPDGNMIIDLRYFAFDYRSMVNMEYSVSKAIMELTTKEAYTSDSTFKEDIDNLQTIVTEWFEDPKYADVRKANNIGSVNSYSAMTSGEAFAAASISDPGFQKVLSLIKTPATQKQSAFKMFIELIKKVISRSFNITEDNTLLETVADIVSTKVFDGLGVDIVTKVEVPTYDDIITNVEDMEDLYPELYEKLSKLRPGKDIASYIKDNPEDEEVNDAINNYIADQEELAGDYITVKYTKDIDAELRKLGWKQKTIDQLSPRDKRRIINNSIDFVDFPAKAKEAKTQLVEKYNFAQGVVDGFTDYQAIDEFNKKRDEEYSNQAIGFNKTLKQQEVLEALNTTFKDVKTKRYPVNAQLQPILNPTEEELKNNLKLTFKLEPNEKGELVPTGIGSLRSTEIYDAILSGKLDQNTFKGNEYTVRGTYLDRIFRDFMSYDTTVVSRESFITVARNIQENMLNDTEDLSKDERDLFGKQEYSDDFLSKYYYILSDIRQYANDNNILIVTDLPRMWGNISGLSITGEADIVAIYPDGKLEIWDLKTSVNNYRTDYKEESKHAFQLSTYSEILEQNLENKKIKVAGIRVINPIVSKDLKSINLAEDKDKTTIEKYTIGLKRKPTKSIKEDYAEVLNIAGIAPTAVTTTPVSTDAKAYIERRRQEALFGNITPLEFETTDTKGRTRKTTVKTKVDENGFKYSFETTVDGKSSSTAYPKVTKQEFINSSIYKNLDQNSKEFIDELPEDAVILLQSIAISTDKNSAAGLGNGNITIGYVSKEEGGRVDDIVLKYQPNEINAEYDALAALEGGKPTNEKQTIDTINKGYRVSDEEQAEMDSQVITPKKGEPKDVIINEKLYRVKAIFVGEVEGYKFYAYKRKDNRSYVVFLENNGRQILEDGVNQKNVKSELSKHLETNTNWKTDYGKEETLLTELNKELSQFTGQTEIIFPEDPTTIIDPLEKALFNNKEFIENTTIKENTSIPDQLSNIELGSTLDLQVKDQSVQIVDNQGNEMFTLPNTPNSSFIKYLIFSGVPVKLAVVKTSTSEDQVTSIEYKIINKPLPANSKAVLVKNLTDAIVDAPGKQSSLKEFSKFLEYLNTKSYIDYKTWQSLKTLINQKDRIQKVEDRISINLTEIEELKNLYNDVKDITIEDKNVSSLLDDITKIVSENCKNS
jgi:hypothetical protein